jgi:hypothetical protein
MLPDRCSFRGLPSQFAIALARSTVLAVALFVAGPGEAIAQNVVTYPNFSTIVAIEVASFPPGELPLLTGAVFFTDGVNSNVNSPCLLNNSGICSMTVPLGDVIELLSVKAPSGLSWGTDASASGGTMTVDSNDPTIANFTPLVAGTYHVVAMVPSLGKVVPITIVINAVPGVTANAGSDQTVNINSVVTLDGSSSTSYSGAPLTYQWSFVSTPAGSQAVLVNPTSVSPTFTPDRPGEYVVQLTVSSLIDNVPESSSASVTISTNIVAPIADAGTAQTVHPIAEVNLDGNQSYDPNGLTLTYSWTLASPAGSNAVLSNPMAVNPSFTVDILGNYTATLVVNDGFLNSAPSSVIVNTSNSAPIANAGTSQSASVGTEVVLNGSGSSDSDGDALTYRWSLVSVPGGSHSVLINPNSVSPSFLPDLPGTYVVGLIVNDGLVDSVQSTVQVLAIASVTSVIQAIRVLQNTIAALPSASFRNRNMQNALLNKLNAVIGTVSSGDYGAAVSQLENDVLRKADGCTSTGSPNGTDWITDCTEQESVDAQILATVSELKGLL